MIRPALPSRAKVILGATCYADAEAALQLAVTLAQQISADLHGCLVEDDAIIASVALPNARGVTYAGGRVNDVTAQSMQAAFRTDARLFQQRLLSAARMASLRAAFSEAQGQLASLMAQAGGTGDLVVFGFRRAPRDPQGVVALFSKTPPDPQLLDLSAQLARSRHTQLTIFADQAFHADIEKDLAHSGVKAMVLAPVTHQADILAQLEKMRPIAVFVGDDAANTARIERLIAAARCPVVVPLSKSPSLTSHDAVT